MQRVPKILRRWLPVALASAASFAFVWEASKEVMRLGANDPQVQMAEDTAAALEAGQPLGAVLPGDSVDVGHSLAPFVIVYDPDGRPLASSGLLHEHTPALPPGVLDYAREHGQNRVTWQPESGVRIAAVVVSYGGDQPGFVLAGRSLREVEQRVRLVGQITRVGLALTLGASFVLVAALELTRPEVRSRS